MEYTKEQIERIKLNTKGGRAPSETLAYIEELETRLRLINGAINEFLQSTGFPPVADINNDAVLLQKPTQQGEEPQNGATGKNGLGDKITLYPDGDPCVCWNGCCGYDGVSFHVETPEEAHALYTALLTIKEVDAD